MGTGDVMMGFDMRLVQTVGMEGRRVHEARVGAVGIRICRTSTKSSCQSTAAVKHARYRRMSRKGSPKLYFDAAVSTAYSG